VHLRLSKRRNVIELRVTDNGIGIPRNERDQLFNRFYRATNVRHRGIRGNGLGLSLVRTIVEAHLGSVLLTNRGRTGTIALIRLPTTPDPVPEQA
jgi:signal transduction histidine kinase